MKQRSLALLALALGGATVVSAVEFPIYESAAALCEVVSAGSPRERAAAELLIETVTAMGGPRLPLVARPSGERPAIHVGGTDFANALSNDFPSGCDRDAFLIRLADPANLVLLGKCPVATGYAVREFLEAYGGVLWVWPGEGGTAIPKRRAWRPDVVSKMDIPAFGMRRFTGVSDDMCAAFRLQTEDPDEFRGLYSHNSWKVIPKSEWATHPEYFNWRDGVRLKPERMKTQLCVSNPEVVSRFVEAARRFFASHPVAETFSVTQGDGDLDYFCKCPACRAYDMPGEKGLSDRYYAFANRVAEGLSKTLPGKTIVELAYGEATCDPPVKTVLRPDVMPCLVLPSMRDKRKSIEAWAKKTDRQLVYFHLFGKPAPKLYAHRFAECVRFLRGQKVIGVCGELAPAHPRLGGSYEVDGPRAWILAKLMWNPDADVDVLLDRFCRGFYGPAAKPMRAFYARLEEAWERLDDKWDFRVDYALDLDGYVLYADADVAFLKARLAEAKALAKDDAEVSVRLDKLDGKLSVWAKDRADALRPEDLERDRAHAVGENLIRNPGFESLRRGAADGDAVVDHRPFEAAAWNKWLSRFDRGTVALDPAAGRKGGRAARFESVDRAQISQSYPVTPGEWYFLSSWWRGGSQGKTTLSVSWTGANGKRLHKSKSVMKNGGSLSATDWRELAMSFKVPEGAVRMIVGLGAGELPAGERVFVDDVSLRKMEAPE